MLTKSQLLHTETFNLAHTDLLMNLDSMPKNKVNVTYFTGQNCPLKKWVWMGIFKPAEPHSQWDAWTDHITKSHGQKVNLQGGLHDIITLAIWAAHYYLRTISLLTETFIFALYQCGMLS